MVNNGPAGHYEMSLNQGQFSRFFTAAPMQETRQSSDSLFTYNLWA